MKKAFVSLLLTAALLGSYAGLAKAGPTPPSPIPGGTTLPKYLQNVEGTYLGQAAYITSGTIALITASVELVIDQQFGQLFTGTLTITPPGPSVPQQFTISGYILKNSEMYFSGSLYSFLLNVRDMQKLEGRGQFKWVKGLRQISADYLVSAFVGDSPNPVANIQFSGGFQVNEQLAE